MSNDKSSVFFSPFLHVSTRPFLMLFFSLELLGFMRLTQPSPSPCQSTLLNHIYCVQSQPLIRASEIQTDLCKTDLCVLILFLNYSPVSTSAPICYPSHSLEGVSSVCMSVCAVIILDPVVPRRISFMSKLCVFFFFSFIPASL